MTAMPGCADCSLNFTVTTTPEARPGARGKLTGWLLDKQVPPSLADAVAQAADTALSDAVRHARADSPGVAAVSASVTETEVVVSVTDDGRWLDPARALGTVRGHGLPLIQDVSRRVDLAHSDGRTTVTAYFDR